ncbi:conserved hypothetical protein [Ricinus communis]|uniref:Uncharacterized protein n=1 Tax=Ricinus communis TaxID=3988 RepID=B9SM20_RICCO|nr:conserved hypothetical protein [Ricinus communis]
MGDLLKGSKLYKQYCCSCAVMVPAMLRACCGGDKVSLDTVITIHTSVPLWKPNLFQLHEDIILQLRLVSNVGTLIFGGCLEPNQGSCLTR